MSKKKSIWDITGIALSGVCLIHCIAIPTLLILFPLSRAYCLPAEDMTHSLLLAFILGVSGIAFVSGYRVHGKMVPVLWMAVGVATIVYATFFAHKHLGHYWEPVLAILGSLALIRAHILNHRCKICEDHGHTHDDLHSHE
jgi:uncharacterized membrane protein YoaT (DUF817 family)